MYKHKIAISACLLGYKVRYDGQAKAHGLIKSFFLNKYSNQVALLPFCPEVAIGLNVPRAKIQLITEYNNKDNGQKDKPIRLVGVEDHTLDLTQALL